ncbi:MAG: type II toxin-antitoxin system RelE/ParE family toxin [Nitrospirota bacterium]|nr:type II toxin-antitoxin system RelE/ParE family toxin [Nitrospirota bacterium]
MNYRLVYTRRAEKDIKKLDPTVKTSIGNSLQKLQDDPVQYSEQLTDPKIGTYRFRIGDYRVIFDIEGKDIVVLRVGHRKDIYRRL